MCEEWDDEAAERFLIEYRRHECLWNPFHASFTDCYARTEALTRIVSALDEEINFKGCLRLIRAIREKYVREQTKALLDHGCHSEQSHSGWRRIVEAMLEKIVCDEERVEETSCRRQRIRQRPQQQTTTTRVKTLFRHTIASSARRKDAIDPEGAGDCANNASVVRTAPLGKNKRKKRGRKKNRSKLENINRFCSDAEKTKERDTCKPSDCGRPGTAWTRQRDNYLDNLAWTTGNCARTVECPAYASHLDRLSRVENICKDPCTLATGNYGCSNRPNQCPPRSCGDRKRSSDIQPTMPCETKSTRSRQSSAGSRRPCSRDRPATCPDAKKRGEKFPIKTCDKMTECCPCPDKKKEQCKDQGEVVCEKELEPKPKTPESCTKDTCPSYQSRCTKADRPPSPAKPCPEPVATTNPIHPSTLDQLRTVRFDAQSDLQSCTYAPRVAARFENGVLEAYSQFKVIFPSPGQTSAPSEKKRRSSIATGCQSPEKSTRRVQTDKTTRDFAVCVTDEELRPKSGNRRSCCAAKCPSRRNMRVGTDEDDVVECCHQDDGGDMLEPGKTIHDFVLLTPGGKYVPLVRTRSDSPEKVVFTECCVDAGRLQQQRVPEVCENASSRIREKQLQNVLDDEKCASSTTKLLLRCLEQMLNLEEQEEKGKPVESKDDPCEPCKRAKARDLECDRQPISGCQPCRADKPTSANPSAGKLTQNFLEILRCALDLDNGKKEYDCDEDAQKQDCCECDALVNKAERPTPENTGEFGQQNKKRSGNDRSVQCNNAFEEPRAAKTTQTTPRGEGRVPPRTDILSSTRFDHQNPSAPREIPVLRLNDYTIPPSEIESTRLHSSPLPNSQRDHNRTPLLWKTSKRKVQEINKDGQYLRVDTTSTFKEASTGGASINPGVQDAGVQEKMPSSSKGTQCETRTSSKSPKDTTKASVGTQKRDTVLEYLVRCAKRPELPSTSQTSPRESTNSSHYHHQTTSRSSRKSRADDTQQQQLCDDCQDPVKYVKCNQVYRSFIVRSPTREAGGEEGEPQVRQQYHRRICALKKVYN